MKKYQQYPNSRSVKYSSLMWKCRPKALKGSKLKKAPKRNNMIHIRVQVLLLLLLLTQKAEQNPDAKLIARKNLNLVNMVGIW